MMMNGMVTFIMAILLLMMLLPWQQNYRLPHCNTYFVTYNKRGGINSFIYLHVSFLLTTICKHTTYTVK